MLLACLLLLLGLAFPLLLNGQTFTNSLFGICFLTGAATICFALEKRSKTTKGRMVRRVIAGIAVFVISILVVLLPANYKFQVQFNKPIDQKRAEFAENQQTRSP
jgi:predicted ABC-type exoprotein transport system permease subunit